MIDVIERLQGVLSVYPNDPYACEPSDVKVLLEAYKEAINALQGLMYEMPPWLVERAYETANPIENYYKKQMERIVVARDVLLKAKVKSL